MLHLQDCRSIKLKFSQALSNNKTEELLRLLSKRWLLKSDNYNIIYREFHINSYKLVVSFVNEVAKLATQQDHHPQITFAYNTVRIEFYTHQLHGLSEKDFIMAEKCNFIFAANYAYG